MRRMCAYTCAIIIMNDHTHTMHWTVVADDKHKKFNRNEYASSLIVHSKNGHGNQMRKNCHLFVILFDKLCSNVRRKKNAKKMENGKRNSQKASNIKWSETIWFAPINVNWWMWMNKSGQKFNYTHCIGWSIWGERASYCLNHRFW